MKCILAKSFGQPEEALAISDEYPRPRLEPGSAKALVKVHACSLSPGDWRTLSGSVDLVRKPPFPYIPCYDICGTVEEVDGAAANKFKVGDVVVATWDFAALGGLAEYALVDPSMAVLKPRNVTHVEAAALANSASHALLSVQAADVKSGDRVLVLGGSGAVGTVAVQLAKKRGASFVACTSTDHALARTLGVDQVINYRKQAWWKDSGFVAKPLDVIIDCAEGLPAWQHAIGSGVLKSGAKGGRFLALTMANPNQHFKKWWQMVGWISGVLWRLVWTRVAFLFVPKFVPKLSSATTETLSEILALAEAGELKTVLDPSSPFPFTLQGVISAFQLQAKTHSQPESDEHPAGPHGKIVVQICS
eukprot:CAMPEP_0114237570 /NCGR_PEP_ID=MMETSP0058-20121206/7462_1 /TAXON_ID=36894 /ORGANISM="Pyramimonas parkeae, CCMP726" /LENGTH=361 /DNA_ID=CAMNT_0001349623 /DNA_START=308 /DNA_END=1393 /DNA_ORIENTATION=+